MSLPHFSLLKSLEVEEVLFIFMYGTSLLFCELYSAHTLWLLRYRSGPLPCNLTPFLFPQTRFDDLTLNIEAVRTSETLVDIRQTCVLRDYFFRVVCTYM